MAGGDAAAGLDVLFDVDRDVVEAYDRWSRSGQPEALAATDVARPLRGGRVFFTGCGATGRLSIQLDVHLARFWQERRSAAAPSPAPDAWENRAFSVMAGGDYALIKSVEGFEDFTPFGRNRSATSGCGRATWCSRSPRAARPPS